MQADIMSLRHGRPTPEILGSPCPQRKAVASVTNNDQPLPSSKILVVDDNVQNRELLEAYMEELEGVTTIAASDGHRALALVETEKPDLILLDIMMPKMSGYEVCKKLKSDPSTKDIPVIMITALHETGDIERAVEVGTNDFITKPVNRLDLLTRVKTLLRIRHVQNQLDRDINYMDELGEAGSAQEELP
jgi:two-component system, OmpR family, alkaline phosphatase synthesis response regulator PhoP